MSSAGAAPRAAIPISNARAEASRKNGAKSRGPRTEEGSARGLQRAKAPAFPFCLPSLAFPCPLIADRTDTPSRRRPSPAPFGRDDGFPP
jgi:hypothetical protein